MMKSVGFLKTINRINVLLSRAKHGMYLISNADTYAHILMWSKVLSMLKEANAISLDGGCREMCDRPLNECGHCCMANCHSEPLHASSECREPCERALEHCGHPCRKTCGEPCGPCTVTVSNLLLPCGHIKNDVLYCSRPTRNQPHILQLAMQ
ncbi:NFX1-type zinc finger-containing protein [Lachnellula willkommii]|uniref:NFX1-type zinc finger-containing protein n=1 Tax=Lachnellula willkommii TaxID=215461 RepID=A0A559M3E8_9HELO|nr:NFX1-type zinc finger-containing protein [Lachnellula willkommii]